LEELESESSSAVKVKVKSTRQKFQKIRGNTEKQASSKAGLLK
jgi:hypothetical protein